MDGKLLHKKYEAFIQGILTREKKEGFFNTISISENIFRFRNYLDSGHQIVSASN